ncbi:hypothetical protein, partial [uncultured Duncaniella sp.]|uniref:hypothetical protein n=1 Tax=uncultured Duncaniella sp. TaxID=2768039 RepID=UPI002614F3B6
ASLLRSLQAAIRQVVRLSYVMPANNWQAVKLHYVITLPAGIRQAERQHCVITLSDGNWQAGIEIYHV